MKRQLQDGHKKYEGLVESQKTNAKNAEGYYQIKYQALQQEMDSLKIDYQDLQDKNNSLCKLLGDMKDKPAVDHQHLKQDVLKCLFIQCKQIDENIFDNNQNSIHSEEPAFF